MPSDFLWMNHADLDPTNSVRVPQETFPYWESRGWFLTDPPLGGGPPRDEYVNRSDLERLLVAGIADLDLTGVVTPTAVAATLSDPAVSGPLSASIAAQVPAAAVDALRGPLRSLLRRAYPAAQATTITTGGFETTSITSGIFVRSVDDDPKLTPNFAYLRAFPDKAGGSFPDVVAVKGFGNTQAAADDGLAVTFQTDSRQVEVAYKSYANANVGPIRVTCDGLLMPVVSGSDSNGFTPGETTGGAVMARVLYKLPSTAPTGVFRDWQVEGVGNFRFFGVGLEASTTVRPRPLNPGPKVIVLGDSYTEGTLGGGGTAHYGNNHASYAEHAARLLGWADCRSSGSGGTGYLNTSAIGGGRPKLSARLSSDLYPYDPDLVIVAMGHNDSTDNGWSVNQVVTEAATDWDAIRTNLPEAGLIVVGPFDGQVGGADSPYAAMSAALKVAAESRGLLYVDPIAQSWVTTANRTTVIGTDNVHPTPAGHRLFGRWLAANLVQHGIASA